MLFRSKNVVFLEYVMEPVVIAQHGIGGSAEEPRENVTLRYAKLTMTYNAYDNTGTKTGSPKTSWNQSTNAAT